MLFLGVTGSLVCESIVLCKDRPRYLSMGYWRNSICPCMMVRHICFFYCFLVTHEMKMVIVVDAGLGLGGFREWHSLVLGIKHVALI